MSDDIPERPKKRLTILPLDMLGVAELENYILELRQEIGRAESMISRKQGHRDVAEKLFGRRDQGG